MTVAIREAAPRDAEQLVANLRALVAEPDVDVPLAPDELDLTVEREREILSELATSLDAVMLVATIGDAIVGQLSLKPISPRRALSHCVTLGISVRRDWRGRGVGRALLAAAIDWAERAGKRRIELHVYARNAAAIHLYEAFGFAHEGRRRDAICERGVYLDDLVMARLV
jgi:RimJ/RimL family protein N-acetyltransferase